MGAVAQRPTGFLAEYGAEASDTGLVLPADLAWDQYVEIVGVLRRINNAVPFYIGDTCIHGEAVYGEAYAQALNDFGMAYQTLANYHSVCRRVPPERRRADLSFSHHAAVSMLEPEQQVYWLEQAAAKDWSRSQLREAIAAGTAQGAGTAAGAAPTPGEEPVPAPAPAPAAAAPRPAMDGELPPAELASQATQVLHAVYDSALPVSTVANNGDGYYAVPVDVLRSVAELLGEEWVEEEPADDGDFRPPVVEGTAAPAAAPAPTDDGIPMAPAAPVQTAHGAMSLDPTQVRIADQHGPGDGQGYGGPPGEPPVAPPPPLGSTVFDGIE